MQREYKNVIFTKHALERLKLRRITQDMVVNTIDKPDTLEHEDDGDIKFIRTIRTRKVHVVSTYLKDENKWLVKSAWVRGEADPVPVWRRILDFPVWLVRKLFGTKGHKRR